MITQASIEALKLRLDIVDVIGGYLSLKKSGLNFGACCPFHGEKTASFVVSSKKQIYHCFGCGVSGDAIKFVQEHEKISFSDAVEKLANSVGITLQYDSRPEALNTKALEQFANYFKQRLGAQQNALDYIAQRKITKDSVKLFGIGYAPSSKEQIEYANKTHINVNELIDCGIFANGEHGVYARFVDRLIFPIKNANGKIVGFGGRTLSSHSAKYINSLQTKLFDKSSILFGYDLAKDEILKTKEMIICEGYIDVIAYHQNGITNATAVLGTALTQKHIPQIKRINPKVFLALDNDKAGQNATLKSAKLLSQNKIVSAVVVFKSGKDAGELIDNKDALLAELSNEKNSIEFIIDKELEAFNINDTIEKSKAKKYLEQLFNELDLLLVYSLREYIAKKFDIPIDINNPPNYKQNESSNFEECILKTMLEKPELIEFVSQRVPVDAFIMQKEYQEILNTNECDLIELKNIKILDLVELQAYIRLVLHEYLTALFTVDISKRRNISNALNALAGGDLTCMDIVYGANL